MSGIEPGWWWAIGGVLLLIAEVVAPGFFLAFIGAAALATGLFTLLFDLGTYAQLILFVLYLAVAVVAGRKFYERPKEAAGEQLNDRAAQLLGRHVTVTSAIGPSGGRVRVGDSEWSARGTLAPVGSTVTVRDVEGNCLIVDQANLPL